MSPIITRKTSIEDWIYIYSPLSNPTRIPALPHLHKSTLLKTRTLLMHLCGEPYELR